MAHRDSIDKIVTSYFAAVNDEPFTYKGKEYPVRKLKISPLLLRGFTCPPNCGGCCPLFSLDYLPTTTALPEGVQKREVEFNGKKIELLSDMQSNVKGNRCGHLQADGRCGIHKVNPFSCDFELIRFLHYTTEEYNVITSKLFGRGWAMKKMDGTKGALCTMTEPTKESIEEIKTKLRKLEAWCFHFGIKNKCDRIIKIIDFIKHKLHNKNLGQIIID